jgi:outer membrane protein OmpA-like peptidoglycan-associated protein
MIFIPRGNLDAFKVNARLLILNGNSVSIILDKGPLNFKKVSSGPILTERHLAHFKDNPLARQTQWFPLLSAQELNIKSYFKDFTGYRPILSHAKFNNPKGKRNRTLNIKDLLERAVKGNKDSFELLAGGIDQFIEENIHKSDKDLAAFYVRRYLNQTSFEKTGWRLTLASWLYRQQRIYKEYQYKSIQNFIYGNTSGDKITPVGNQLYQYEIEVKVSGFGVGYFVKGGYYRGTITITCKQWDELGVKNPDGTKEAKLRIQFGELGGGLVKSINFGQSFAGVAESDVLWMPADFVGLISILKADAEVGANITKIRKKLGISAGVGATMGMMEIIGDSSLPPLMFGVYSLSGVVGGVEPEPEIEREGRVGVEVTGSVVIGSIWKDGPLPVPKDVIKYGNEETVLKTTYQGDGKAHFKHDSALLTPGAVNLIRKLCANEMFLLMSPKTTVTITGHTDMSGTDKHNEGLSKNRAANVRQKIIDICGNKINAVIDKPLYKGAELAKKDPARKQYDPRYRRVDITINGTLVLSLVEV